MDALREEQRRRAVAEIVKPHPRQARALDERLERPAEQVARRDRLPGGVRKDEIVILPCAPEAEPFLGLARAVPLERVVDSLLTSPPASRLPVL